MRAGVPEEGREVVLHGSAAAALEVDEARMAVPYHYVTSLEVAVHKGVALVPYCVAAEAVDIVLQAYLIETYWNKLEEVVFEVVQVEVDHTGVEFPVRIADAPVKGLADLVLQHGQHPHRFAQPAHLFGGKAAVGNVGLEQFEQLGVPEVFLDVAEAVRRYPVNPGRIEVVTGKLLRNGYECPVFGHAGSYAADDRRAIMAGHPVIFAGAAGKGQQCDGNRLRVRVFPVQFFQTLHNNANVPPFLAIRKKAITFVG